MVVKILYVAPEVIRNTIAEPTDVFLTNLLSRFIMGVKANAGNIRKVYMNKYATFTVGLAATLLVIYVALFVWNDQPVFIDFRSMILVGVTALTYSFVATSHDWISLEELSTGALLVGIVGVSVGLSLTLSLPPEEQITAWPYVFLPMIYGVILKIACDGLTD